MRPGSPATEEVRHGSTATQVVVRYHAAFSSFIESAAQRNLSRLELRHGLELNLNLFNSMLQSWCRSILQRCRCLKDHLSYVQFGSEQTLLQQLHQEFTVENDNSRRKLICVKSSLDGKCPGKQLDIPGYRAYV